MKLPILNKFRKEDYPDAPEWWSKSIITFNQFFDSVYNLFNGNITIGDNIDSAIVMYKLRTTDLPYTFSIPTKRKPQIVIIGSVENDELGYHEVMTSAVYADWELVGNEIRINSIVGLPAGTRYRITFKVE